MVKSGDLVEIKTKIRGVSHRDPHTNKPRQKIIRSHVRTGTKIIPVLEPENPYGDHTIGLWVTARRKRYHLGYISTDLSERLTRIMRSGIPLTITVIQVTGGTRGKKTRGVNISIRYRKPAIQTRKASSAQVASPPQTQARPPLPSHDFSGEREYHTSENLRITSERVRIGDRNYLLPDISEVRVHVLSKATGCGSLAMAIGAVGVLLGALIVATSLSEIGDVITGLVLAAIFAVIAGVGFLLNANVQERHAVDIVTRAGVHRLMRGTNTEACQTLADAVTRAIDENVPST